jgi:ATP-dependent exoDNAse (exonuclease V) alpha subunit
MNILDLHSDNLSHEESKVDWEKDSLKSLHIAEKLIDGLNVDQKAAFIRLKNFILSDDDSIFVLKGYAGTGKTFLIRRLIDFISQYHGGSPKVALTAPTNKAVRVIMKSAELKGKNIKYVTTHSLLGLRESINSKGEIEFVKDGNSKIVMDADYLVIDELSMLDDKLFKDFYDNHRTKMRIIMMGDPAQIPPVHHDNCIPFRKDATQKYKMRVSVIKEIMRQTHGNPIIEASLAIRQNITKENPIPDLKTSVDAHGNGLIVINAKALGVKDLVKTKLKEYFNTQQFRTDADFCKVIAWRNKTVDYFNNMVRDLIFGEGAPQIVVGEKLIVLKPVIQEKDNKTFTALTTSEELEVVIVQEDLKKIWVLDKAFNFPVYNCLVEFQGPNGRKSMYICVLAKEGKILYEQCKNDLKKAALELQGKTASSSWFKYYKFMREFADVTYNYAITAHRAQGSTYQNVFLAEDDIDVNSKIIERNRIKYTSYSRPTKKLFVIKSIKTDEEI